MDPQEFANQPAPRQLPPAFNEIPQTPGTQPPGTQTPTSLLAHPQMAQQLFNDPDAMAHIASIYYKHGIPGGVEWLARGHEAAKNNVFEAFGHLQAGDGDAAVAALQKSTRFRDVTGATPNDDGTWTFSRASGQSQIVDPKMLMNSLLTPQQQVQAQQHQDELGVKKEHNRILASQAESQDIVNRAHGKYFEGAAKFQEERGALMDERNQILARAKDAQMSQALEVAGVKADAAREIAAMKGNPSAVRKKIVEDLTKNLSPGDDPAKVNAMADQLTRAQFVDVHKNPAGEGFVVVDKMRGPSKWIPVATYPDMETASAAATAYVTGKNLPAAPAAAGKGAAAVKAPGTSSPGLVRRLIGPSTSTATVKDLDATQLQNVVDDPKTPPDIRTQAAAALQAKRPRALPPDQPAMF